MILKNVKYCNRDGRNSRKQVYTKNIYYSYRERKHFIEEKSLETCIVPIEKKYCVRSEKTQKKFLFLLVRYIILQERNLINGNFYYRETRQDKLIEEVDIRSRSGGTLGVVERFQGALQRVKNVHGEMHLEQSTLVQRTLHDKQMYIR